MIASLSGPNAAPQPQRDDLRVRSRQALQEAVRQRGEDPSHAPSLSRGAVHEQARSAPQPGAAEQMRLSDEMVEELQKSGTDPERNGNLEALLHTMAPAALDRQEAGPEGVGEAGGAEKGKAARKETVVQWTPTTKEGEILGGHDKIGEVEIKEKTVQGGKDGSSQRKGLPRVPKVGFASPGSGNAAAGKGAASGSGAPQVGAAAPASKTGQGASQPAGQDEDDDKETDKVELSQESLQTASKLQNQGIALKGLNPTGSQDGAKDLKAGEVSEKTVGQEEITTRAGGMNQTAWVRDAGRVGDGDLIRLYQKLDDMPDDLVVGHKKKTGNEAADDYQRKVEKGEATSAVNEQQLQKLRTPAGNER